MEALSLRRVVVASLLLAGCNRDLAFCDHDVAFELPRPGDILELHATICLDEVEPTDLTVSVADPTYTYEGVALTVVGNGVNLGDQFLAATMPYTTDLCDAGLAIALENTLTSGPYIGVLRFSAYNDCEIEVESP
jgi:hypothetical protein